MRRTESCRVSTWKVRAHTGDTGIENFRKCFHDHQDTEEKYSLKTLCCEECGLSASQEPATLINRCPAGGRDNGAGTCDDGCGRHEAPDGQRVTGKGAQAPSDPGPRALIPRAHLILLCWPPREGRTPKRPRVRCWFPSVWRTGRGHVTARERNRCSRIAPASCKARRRGASHLALILSRNPRPTRGSNSPRFLP